MLALLVVANTEISFDKIVGIMRALLVVTIVNTETFFDQRSAYLLTWTLPIDTVSSLPWTK
jgi:hypothetical protein